MTDTGTRLMIMAGGTGGHVFPALAVARAMRERNTEVTWLGTRRGIEARIVPANDFAIEWISIEGLRGKGALSWLLAPLKLARAMWQSVGAIRRARPDCVLGMGGFVAGPGGLVARLMGTPLVIHEQNAVAGLTNRYLAKIATRVLSGFEHVEGLPAHTRWVGNPVRDEIQSNEASSDHNVMRVLVIGGSQGALSFNQHLPDVFAKQSTSLEIWHQSGTGRSEAVQSAYQAAGLQAKVSDFIEDMATAYQWADLLICRAGAMTLAECCAAGKAALLIPYPHSAGDHQLKNGQALVAAGAARVVSNAEIASPLMVSALAELLQDKTKVQAMGRAARSLHKPNALRDVVAACEEVLNA